MVLPKRDPQFCPSLRGPALQVACEDLTCWQSLPRLGLGGAPSEPGQRPTASEPPTLLPGTCSLTSRCLGGASPWPGTHLAEWELSTPVLSF